MFLLFKYDSSWFHSNDWRHGSIKCILDCDGLYVCQSSISCNHWLINTIYKIITEGDILRFVAATILVGFMFFVTLILMAVFSMTFHYLKPELQDSASEMGIGGHVNHLLDTIEIIGWTICTLFGAGTIITYLISSHYQEYERYENPRGPYWCTYHLL